MKVDNFLQGLDAQPSFLESVPEEGEINTDRHIQMDTMDDSGRVSEMKSDSVRMPSTLTTRARLVRTPAHRDDAPRVMFPESAEEQTERHEPDILITELKEQPELVEGDDDGEESDIEPEYRQVTVETVDVEEDWDTDLEIEGGF